MTKILHLIMLFSLLFCFSTEGHSSQYSRFLVNRFEVVAPQISRALPRRLFSKVSQTTLPERVKIVEVGPRDGLQNEDVRLSVSERLTLIGHLQEAGLEHIEAGAFVSPGRVPQMAGSLEVAQHLAREVGSVSYPFLVPNMQGLELAMQADVKDIAIFTSPSTTFTQKNIEMTVEESLIVQEEVTRHALANGMAVRGYVSCVMGCPYEGEMAPEDVVPVVEKLLNFGCHEISLGDTIGVGTPERTRMLCRTLFDQQGFEPHLFAAHFHDTNGLALPNLVVALRYGITVIDSSIAGLGSCPYAPGATGNVATERVVALLDSLSIENGVNREKLEIAKTYALDVLRKEFS